MMQSFFNGLSGLLTFSRGLKNVSNNVSNMNTPGFRGSDTFYRSVSGEGENGLGADIAGTALRSGQGELRQTGNDTDIAIDGQGFFVLRTEKGEQLYSRAGQFKLDEKNNLVDSVTGHKVMGRDASGSLVDINLDSVKILPPKPTTKINFTGNLVTPSTTATGTHSISAVNVYDTSGAKVVLSVDFASTTTPMTGWNVTVKNASGTQVGSGLLRFGPDGSPMAGFNTITMTLSSNGQSQAILLNFGDPGSLTNATQFSGASSTLGAAAADGSPLAGLTSLGFDEAGVLQIQYSSGEKKQGAQLALADFLDESVLKYVKGSLYGAPDSVKPDIGVANTGAFGKIQGGYIELSNVDLAQEFGDILIIQRGYQASSRVMTVANEMLEQLYGGGSRGG